MNGREGGWESEDFKDKEDRQQLTLDLKRDTDYSIQGSIHMQKYVFTKWQFLGEKLSD